MVTATSLNSGLLLLSRDPRTTGSASVTLSGLNASLTLQALASQGTVEVILSAPGYRSSRIAVVLRPTVLALSIPYSNQSMLTLHKGETSSLRIALLVRLLQSSGFYSGTPRTGANIYADFTVDQPGIVAIEPAHVSFGGSSTVDVAVRGVAVGTTSIRMTVPPGIVATGTPMAAAVAP
jgi:hypothetical protein